MGGARGRRAAGAARPQISGLNEKADGKAASEGHLWDSWGLESPGWRLCFLLGGGIAEPLLGEQGLWLQSDAAPGLMARGVESGPDQTTQGQTTESGGVVRGMG